MEEVKRIPYGVSNFVEVVEQNQYYVDKTIYLPLLEEQPSNLFFIRPRRFGKSIFLSMLRAYYDIAQREKFDKRFALHGCKGLSRYSFLTFPVPAVVVVRWPRTSTVTAVWSWICSVCPTNLIIFRDLLRR